MEVRLLKKNVIKTEEFYKDFLDDQIKLKDEYFTGNSVFIDNAPDFPIYIAKGSEKDKRKLFHEAFDTISKYYFPLKELDLLEEMSNSRYRSGNTQDETGLSC